MFVRNYRKKIVYVTLLTLHEKIKLYFRTPQKHGNINVFEGSINRI